MKQSLIIGLILASTATWAQVAGPQALSAAGDQFFSGSMYMSYTVGGLLTRTFPLAGDFLTQGFQQHGDFAVGIQIPGEPELHFRIWPNPMADRLFIRFDAEWETDIVLEVYDILGRLHRLYRMVSPLPLEPTSLDVSYLESGIYLLKFQSADRRSAAIIRMRKE